MKKILPVMLVTALASGLALQAQADERMMNAGMTSVGYGSDEISNWHKQEGVMNHNLAGKSVVGDRQSFPSYGSDEIFNWHEEEMVHYSKQGKVAYNSTIRREYTSY